MDLSAPIYRLKRQAKNISRKSELPLHAALDRVAREEGYKSWSHLSAALSSHTPAKHLLGSLQPGELVLLAARPEQGKTTLALELLIEACRQGKHGYFFTLDFTSASLQARLAEMCPDGVPDHLITDTSDDICATYILGRAADAPDGAVVAIDYMQLLDQKRALPSLEQQIATLHAAARFHGLTIILISQVSRNYDPVARPLPGLADVNLPNPIDLTCFSKACFLQDGKIRLSDLGPAHASI